MSSGVPAFQRVRHTYYYLDTYGSLTKMMLDPEVCPEERFNDELIIKWWRVTWKSDAVAMMNDIKSNYHGKLKDIKTMEDHFGITHGDYFKEAVRVAAKEGK